MIAQTNGHATKVLTGATIEERPIGELFQDLAQNTSRLVSLEMELAKTELAQTASKAGKDVGYMAAGGLVAYAGLLAIIAAVIVGLANFIPAWLSAFIIGAVVVLVGYGLLKKGMNDLKNGSLAPKQTMDSLKKDKQYLQEKI